MLFWFLLYSKQLAETTKNGKRYLGRLTATVVETKEERGFHLVNRMKIEHFKRIDKGCIKAGFSIVIPEWKITIHNCSLMQKNKHRWIAFPCKEYNDPEGKSKKFNLIFMEHEAKDKFDSSVMKLLDEIQDSPIAIEAEENEFSF